jgi:two-component sensor histidine kinase
VRAYKSIGKWEKSLREKEVLLSEIHHRVKNNLAVISGFLDLEEMKNGSSQKAISNSRERIQSMAMIHELLYESNSFSDIDMCKYGNTLLHQIKNSYPEKCNSLEFREDFHSLRLNINQAVPLGLLLSEILTAVMQQIDRDNPSGSIHVTMREQNSRVNVRIEKEGCLFSSAFDLNETDATDLSIIKALSDQLEGEVNLDDNDTMLNLWFAKSDQSGSSSNHF